MSAHCFAPTLSLLIGFTLLASAEGQPRLSPGQVAPIAQLLASPDRYAEKEVLIGGTVVKKARAVFPNDRPYFTLLVSDGEGAIRVFSWEEPPVENGDSVEVSGTFHIWRYNLSQMIESRRITRSGPSLRSVIPRRAS
jgi:hypothetical protein